MSQTVSPFAKRPYGLARVCRVWRLARSTYFHRRGRPRRSDHGIREGSTRRGPLGAGTDTWLTERIREVLAASPWVGEGHRKVWAQLRFRGIRTSRRRVLRLMREANLLAPVRSGHRHGPKAHDRTIIPERPDVMWGTDTTSTLTSEGNDTIFFIVDHCTAECLGIHAARPGTRYEALEPVRQGVGAVFGTFEKDIAAGLTLRHDHGSQFISDVFQDELRFLGIAASPSFVREPQGNGCAERFVRTLKEQLLWLRFFTTVDELNQALHEFKERYNHHWLIERHGHISPTAYREQLHAAEAAA